VDVGPKFRVGVEIRVFHRAIVVVLEVICFLYMGICTQLFGWSLLACFRYSISFHCHVFELSMVDVRDA